METKQVYRFSSEIIDELSCASKMNFRLRDLHLPFFSLYLDVSAGKIMIDGKHLEGAYIRVCLPPETSIIVDGVLYCPDGGCRIFKYAASYAEDRPVQEIVDEVTGDYEGDAASAALIFQLLSYISSDEPDLKCKGRIRYLVEGRYRKPMPAAHTEWDVGCRYIKEQSIQRDLPNIAEKIAPIGTHASPRAHIRRGHWHIYHYGPGKSLTKVRWVSEMMIGNGNPTEVVRMKN